MTWFKSKKLVDNNAVFNVDTTKPIKQVPADVFSTPQIHSKESPKQILDEDYPKHQWPISGGWGYSEDTACVIELDTEGSGVEFEDKFIEYRTYEELIVFRPRNDRYSGIRVRKGNQYLLGRDEKHFDKVEYTVTAWRDADWDLLKQEWESHNAFKGDPEGLSKHLKRRESLKVTYETVGWFDITRFFGKE